MTQTVIGIRLKADGSGFVGELRLSKKQLDALAKATRKTGREARQGARGIDKFGRDAAGAGRQARGLARRNADLGRSFAGLRGVIATLGLGLLIRQGVQLSDTWTLMRGRIGLVVREGQNLDGVIDDLFGRAQEARVEFDAFNKVFFRVARALNQNAELAGRSAEVTTLLAKSARIGGASAVEMNAGLLQLSQGLASGQLRGEELRSVMENIPDVARRLADGLGLTIGQLRKLGEQGGITTKVFVKGFLSQGDVITSEFARLPRVVGEALTQLRNEIQRQVGEGAAATNRTSGLAQAIDRLRDAAGDAIPVLVQLGGDLVDITALGADNLGAIVALTGAYITYRGVLKGLTLLQAAQLIPSMRIMRDITFAVASAMRLQLVPAAVLATAGLAKLRAGLAALRLAIVANPLVAAAVAAAALAGGYLLLRGRTDQLTAAQERQNAVLAETKRLNEETVKISAEMSRKVLEEARVRSLNTLTITNQSRALALAEQARLRAALAANQAAREQAGPLGSGGGRSVERGRLQLGSEAKKLKKQLGDIDKQLKELDGASAAATASLQKLREALSAKVDQENGLLSGAALDKLKGKFADLEEALQPALKRTREFETAANTLEAAFKKGLIPSGAEFIRLLKLLINKFPSAAAGAKAFTAAAVKRNKDEIRLAKLSERDRKIELATRRKLAEAKKQGIELSDAQAQAIRAAIAARVDAVTATNAQADAERRAGEEIKRIQDVARENIQEAFANGLFNIEDAKDFFHQVEIIGRRAISEIAAKKIFEKFPDLAEILGFGALGSGLANILGLAGGGTAGQVLGAGGSIGGSIIGKQLGGKKGQKIGAAIGSFIGTALGGFLFGKKQSLQVLTAGAGSGAAFEDAASRQTPFGLVGFSRQSSIGKDATAGLVEALARIDETISGALTPTQIAAASSALLAQQSAEGPGRGERLKFGKKDLGEKLFLAIRERLETILDAALDKPGVGAKAFAKIKPAQENLDLLVSTATDIIEIPKMITEELARIKNPLKFELDQLDRIFADRVKQFTDFGISITELEALHAEQRKQIIEKFSNQATGRLQDLLVSLTSGPQSTFAPATVLATAQSRFDELFASAQTGDQAALDAFPGAAQNLLAALENNFASSEAFFQGQDKVISALEQLIDTSTAPPDLAPLLGDINASIDDGNRDIVDELGNIGNLLKDVLAGAGGGFFGGGGGPKFRAGPEFA